MTINAGDTAWLLISAALVMLMTPGLAFFYGGMVRRKNLLSTLMMSFVMLGVGGLVWALIGYSLGFGTDVAGVVGGLNYVALRNVGQAASPIYATTVPHLAYMAYQGMFAVITVALITGAVAERIKFSTLLMFSVIWLTVIYAPVAHWIWEAAGWASSAPWTLPVELSFTSTQVFRHLHWLCFWVDVKDSRGMHLNQITSR